MPLIVVLIVAALCCRAEPVLANVQSETLRHRATTAIYNLDRDEAIDLFRQAIAADPQDAAAYRGLAMVTWLSITFRRGNMTVDEYLGKVTRPNDQVPAPPPDAAATFRANIDKAMALARQRLSANDRDADAHYQLGSAVGLQASYTATVEGRVLGAFKFARQAYSEHERVMELSPTRKDAGLIVGTYRYLVSAMSLPIRLMAYVAGFGGGKERGVRMIEEAAAFGGENRNDARFALILMYNRDQRWDEALRLLQALRNEYPRNRLAWLETGSTTLRAGRFADAEAILSDGLARFADDVRPRMFGEAALWYYKRGAARVGLRRRAEAEQDLRRVLDLEARGWVKARTHTELGKLADLTGERARARTEYETALRLSVDAHDQLNLTAVKALLQTPYR